MEVQAKLNFIRISPKKMRLVADQIRGVPVSKALEILKFSNKISAKSLAKLLHSAIANAEHNFNLEKENLYIKAITVDEGSSLKRWQPKAFGRATPIRKRSSKIIVTLTEIKESGKAAKRMTEIEEPIKLSEALKEKEPEKVEQEIKKDNLAGKEGEHKEEIVDKRMQGKHRHGQHLDKRQSKEKGGFLKKIFNRKAD